MDFVSAICRKCGKSANSNDFRLDLDLKMMVCQACIKAKSNPKKGVQNVPQVAEVKKDDKPADWDEVDEMLAKRPAQKVDSKPTVVEIGTTGKGKYACIKCKYGFTYNFTTKTPNTCPFCNTEVPIVRIVRS